VVNISKQPRYAQTEAAVCASRSRHISWIVVHKSKLRRSWIEVLQNSDRSTRVDAGAFARQSSRKIEIGTNKLNLVAFAVAIHR